MRKLAAVITLCCLPLFSFAQTAQQQYKEYAKRGLIWQYDKFRDETTLLTKPQLVLKPGLLLSALADAAHERSSIPTIAMGAGVIYKGNGVPPATETPILAFQISANGWQQLKSDREVRMIVDGGAVVMLGAASYDGEVQRRGGFITAETLLVQIERAQLAQLAAAKAASFQIGRMSFPVKTQHLKTLQPLLEILQKQ